MGSISQIGNWDIERGEPIDLGGNPDGPLVNYERLNCRLAGYPDKLTCSGTALDLERGLINGAQSLPDGHTQRTAMLSAKGNSTIKATLPCRSSRRETGSTCC